MAEKKVDLTISIEIPSMYEADADLLYFKINEEIDEFRIDSASIRMEKAKWREINVQRNAPRRSRELPSP